MPELLRHSLGENSGLCVGTPLPDLEQERLAIERERLALENARAEREARFINRNSGPLLSAIVAALAISISAYQNIKSEQNHLDEIKFQNSQKEHELQTADYEWKRKVAELFIQHDRDIFQSNQQTKNRFISIFVATLPNDILKVVLPQFSSALVTSAEDYSTLIGAVQSTNLPKAEQATLQSAVELSVKQPTTAGDSNKPVVYVHYQNASDSDAVDLIISALRQTGYRVPGKQLVVQATSGDVRYYKPEDRDAAAAVREAVQTALVDRFKFGPKSLMDLSKTFPNLPRGIVELWLPSLPPRG
jgi:hypothetical protein